MKLKTKKKIAYSILGVIFGSVYIFTCWIIPLESTSWKRILILHHGGLIGFLAFVCLILWCCNVIDREIEDKK